VGYITKGEELIDRKIRYLILKEEEIFDLDARWPERLMLFGTNDKKE